MYSTYVLLCVYVVVRMQHCECNGLKYLHCILQVFHCVCTPGVCVCCCATCIGESETLKAKSEEKMLKLKGLLKKTHNELTEAKKNEAELNQTISDLQSQLQEEQLRSEEAKVSRHYLVAGTLGRLWCEEWQMQLHSNKDRWYVRTLQLPVRSWCPCVHRSRCLS